MMTSGLVVTLDQGSPDEGAALAAIDANPSFTAGERDGCRLPLALEAEDAGASERWVDWLGQLPGVIGVEVVFVHWDVMEATDAGA